LQGSGQSSTCIFFDAMQLSQRQVAMSWQSVSILHASRAGSTPVARRGVVPSGAGSAEVTAGVMGDPTGALLAAPLEAGATSTAGCGVALGVEHAITSDRQARDVATKVDLAARTTLRDDTFVFMSRS
jgi:hypothetical protein